MRLKKALAAIFSVLTFSWSCVIWSFSMLSAEASSVQSGEVTGFINKLLGFLFEGGLSDAVVRKLAHFAEFALLGIFIFLTLWAFSLKSGRNKISLLFLISGFVATVDEVIQLTSPGRAFRVSDILLDISGAVTAFLILELIVFVSKRIKNKKSR
ncbi:MAG: VanZ family protein [Clostridia bacterium]|nr:VanZ family protein [Clostridia bacterium]